MQGDPPSPHSSDGTTALKAPDDVPSLKAILPWLLVASVIICAALIRLRLLSTPLERDEGEYAYVGQLMLEGIAPYKIAFNMKFPGTYAAYAAIMAVFGQSVTGIHMGFLLVNALTIVLIFLLGKSLWNASAGVTACAAYALMSVSMGVMGTQAHATHFVVLAVVPATLLLLRALDNSPWRLAASGFLFGVAVLMKQHAALFVLFGSLLLLWNSLSQRHERWPLILKTQAVFWSAVAGPLVLTGLALWRAGVFGQFWFWTITYAREYVSLVPLRKGITMFTFNGGNIIDENVSIWVFALAGLILLWMRKLKTTAVSITGLLLFSFLAVCPGLYFREHYFVLVLPAVALLAGSVLASVAENWPRAWMAASAIFVVALGVSIVQQSYLLFSISPLELSRQLYGPSPFPEAIPIGDYLRSHTPPDAQIAVFGSEPEIPFYAHRHMVSGYLYMYGMMEPHPFALRMQEEWIHDVETARPAYIVAILAPDSWARVNTSPTRIFDWWNSWSSKNYDAVGVAQYDPPEPPHVQWGDPSNVHRSPNDFVLVYRRKGL